MKYGIGLDIGITSIGWATVLINEEEIPFRIKNLGTRIFDAAENPKDGSSLALPRREARSARRRLRRHRHRLERIKALIVNCGLLNQNQFDQLYAGKVSDIYAVRAEALDRRVTNVELARVMIHLAQRRGFKSNRKSDFSDKEAGALLNAVSTNVDIMEGKHYRTVGEMLYRDERFAACKRNKGENYTNTVSRSMIEEEARLIFKAQREFGVSFTSEDNENRYIDILTSQRSFEEGPGGNSPYGGNQVENMIGRCVFEEDEKRAAKACYSSEYCTLLQSVNIMRIQAPKSERGLNHDERNRLIELAHTTGELSYSKIRKLLELGGEERFKSLSYGNKDIKDVEDKTKFNYLKSYHQMRKALDKISKNRIKTITIPQRDAIGYALTVYKTDTNIIDELSKVGLDSIEIEALLGLPNFSKFGRLSLVACKKIIPFLEKGMVYSDACKAAGYNFKAHNIEKRQHYLPKTAPELDDLTNPVARRAIAQTIKVINAIIREQGESPVFINIELARELSKTREERNKADKSMKDNQAYNDRLMERLRSEFGRQNPTGMDLVKLKLWEEQGGFCPYSQQVLHIEDIFSPGYADVDHIVPYSISFDDSYKNKVLVRAEENRQKGNRLPLQYLTGPARDRYIVWVNNTVKNYKKKQILLKEKLSEEDRDGFLARNLQDTQYITRFVYNFINDHLEFASFESGKKRHVFAINGAVTAYLRKRWGIAKVREDGDLHHTVDALVIACTTQNMIKRVSQYSKYKELEYVKNAETGVDEIISPVTGEVLKNFPLPWRDFRKELEGRLSNIPSKLIAQLNLPTYSREEAESLRQVFVSRMPKHKVTGAAHKDTVKSPKYVDEGVVLIKRPLTALKLDKVTGEIEDYYNPSSDRLLYNALKNRLIEYGGNGVKAFEKPFYKPTSNGELGPLVKKIKLTEKTTLNVLINDGNGVADNNSMVRIDVFYVEGEGYYWVPIYVADTLKYELPNKAVVPHKPYSSWKEMSDENFIFSLYSNDLVNVTAKKSLSLKLINSNSTLPKERVENAFMAYYISGGISTASITVINHDKTYTIASLGIKTLVSLEKYQIDALGNYFKCGREKRQKFR